MLLTESNRQNLLLVVTILALMCFFSSFLLFVCAAYIKITIDSQMKLLETFNSDVLPAIFIFVGVINIIQNVAVVVVSFRLMKTDQREFLVPTMMYILVGGIVLVVFELAAAIASFVHISLLDREFGEGISKAMGTYIEGGELKREIDIVQMTYSCCGDKSYVDWFRYQWIDPENIKTHGGHVKRYLQSDGKYYSDDTPFSCCDPRSPRPCIHHHVQDSKLHHKYNVNEETTLYVTGCRVVLMSIYGKVLLTVGLIATAIALVKITVLLLFRLLQTSLTKAQVLDFWQAATHGYIYTSNLDEENEAIINTEEENTTTELETSEPEEKTDQENNVEDENENRRYYRRLVRRRHRRKDSDDNRNISCVTGEDGSSSQISHVTDELCQRFLFPGKKISADLWSEGTVESYVMDNIRQHMTSRLSFHDQCHINGCRSNNNCYPIVPTENYFYPAFSEDESFKEESLTETQENNLTSYKRKELLSSDTHLLECMSLQSIHDIDDANNYCLAIAPQNENYYILNEHFASGKMHKNVKLKSSKKRKVSSLSTCSSASMSSSPSSSLSSSTITSSSLSSCIITDETNKVKINDCRPDSMWNNTIKNVYGEHTIDPTNFSECKQQTTACNKSWRTYCDDVSPTERQTLAYRHNTLISDTQCYSDSREHTDIDDELWNIKDIPVHSKKCTVYGASFGAKELYEIN